MISKLIEQIEHYDWYNKLKEPLFNSDEEEKQLLSELEATQWIPVSEGLPEKFKEVLVKLKYQEQPEIAFYRGKGGWCFPMSENAEIVGSGYYYGEFTNEPKMGVEITHWQPLPQPPEQKEDA
jgi:hypothetical protein